MKTMGNYSSEWRAIRTDWVNGNRKDAKEALFNSKKDDLLMLIRAALLYSYQELLGNIPGDLIDLLEMLKSYHEVGK